MIKHIADVDRYVPAKCGAPGHHDAVISCTCGYTNTISHGNMDAIRENLLYHRINFIEKQLGITFSAEFLN